MILTLIIIFILLLFSAFFSGSETAFTAVSRPYMHQLEQTGDKRANLVNQLQQDQGHVIGAIL
jgi:Mg2+/Co2+ transporter CorB